LDGELDVLKLRAPDAGLQNIGGLVEKLIPSVPRNDFLVVMAEPAKGYLMPEQKVHYVVLVASY
jgi:hypothetical protein